MRLINWETRLVKYIESMHDYPFIWGESDCCHFANKAIEVITGKALDIPKIYTAAGVAEYLKDNGGIEAVTDKFLPRKEALYASRGDIVSAVVDGRRIGLGVCMGDYAVFKTGESVTRIPLNSIFTAWAVE